MMWSCHSVDVWRLVRWFVFGPGIAKPRPGKSDRMGGRQVLPADLCDVGLELVAFCLGNSACSNVA